MEPGAASGRLVNDPEGAAIVQLHLPQLVATMSAGAAGGASLASNSPWTLKELYFTANAT
jgi:hypothetical protein